MNGVEMVTQEGERQPFLVCVEGSLVGQRQPIGKAGLVLGRGEHCDIVFEDAEVSREHARVLLHLDQVWVQDLGSRNGCFINERRLVRHKALSPGDVLRLGHHRFVLEMVDPLADDDNPSASGAASAQRPLQASGSTRVRSPLVSALVVGLVLIAAFVAAWLFAQP